ncbi:hypothetical protein [Siphonobacter sp. SORGH_AS_1065]|uniref:DUF3108 domain-containing protein n=1 Tax=Siphonobacter sp. SORGH_AS_1065 TaxID=3041795 RepID=UPI00277D1B0D|nr:hypothetical protein [Siphonobacter sp. SORGH_AS_1065]MDQ1090554.1 hypothetical protein [Siphonobacter sp. SORGH_AS_1065]
MKYLLLAFYLCCFSVSHAQLKPSKDAFEKKWVKPDTYDMVWYALRDTAKIEIGRVSNQIIENKNQIVFISTVDIKGMNGTWVDSSICEKATLSPIRHASYNGQRDMVLHFGQVVTGFYTDKRQAKTTIINDTPQTSYFDSNIYPSLVRWLPLKEGFKQKIAIYDYNPLAKIGIINASVHGVSSGTYNSQKSGLREVWIVDVTDEISNGKSQYFVDKTNRKLWKQTIEAGGRTMMMVTVE